ncbi:MAG: DNA translocase FtsK [Chitinispirillaceae bacterium]|nr:DNA translocase FtsK [Chitinispirillaceae bacterium]
MNFTDWNSTTAGTMPMGRKKKEKKNVVPKVAEDFGHEIWGIVFLAIALLILIALLSHFVAPRNNILGYYFGTALAGGLIFFLGPVCVFCFPVAVGILGWQRFRGELLNFRLLFFGILITAETCLLLAIHHLPRLHADPSLAIPNNQLGVTLVRIIRPAFGPHVFGPYFIAMLVLVVTVLSAFRISPQKLFGWIRTATLFCIDSLKIRWKEWKEQRTVLKLEQEARAAEKRRLKEEQLRQVPPKNGNKPPKSPEEKPLPESIAPPPEEDIETTGEEPEIIPEEEETALLVEKDITTVEEEARQRLDQELAAFRAKRSDPIQIMSIETTEFDPEEEIDAFPDAIIDTDPQEHKFPTTTTRKAGPAKPYVLPEPSILPDPPPPASMIDKEDIEQKSMILEKTLMNFSVEGKVVFVSPGPVVTRYEIELAPGIKVSKVVNLHDDLSMAVGGQRIRIEAPIPGKSAVGIELPNAERQIVHFKHILLADTFRKTKAKLPIIIGTNVSGAPYVTDVTKMPHVLIAGQTGSGKSVCINSLICSLLMTMKPEELRLIMIDPKKVELAFYEGIPHLMSPVVTESKEAVKALQWGVIEMERRYRMLAKVGARNIDSFNERIGTGKFDETLPEEDNKKLPFIVIIVDELADLMLTASRDVEGLIQRIAQLARAVGIHLIVATQRPSVDIITGPIKANLTSRISFRTIQSTDSRTILGHVGAEKLLGMGDMLFLRNGAPEIERFHGAFISEGDVEKIASAIRAQQVEIDKIDSFSEATGEITGDGGAVAGEDRDELFEEAARTIVSIGQGSTSLLQRRMKIGYARAGRLMDELERAGIVGPPDGSKAREVLVKPDELDELLGRLR